MSIWDFISGASGFALNERQIAQQRQWELVKQQKQLDIIEQQERFRAAIRGQMEPPQRRQFRDDKTGGLMEVESKWDPESQSWQDFGSPTAVPVSMKDTLKLREGDQEVTYGLMSDGTRQELGRGNAFSPRQRDTSQRSPTDDGYRRDRLSFDIRKQVADEVAEVRVLRPAEQARVLEPYGGSIEAFEQARMRHYGGSAEPKAAPDKREPQNWQSIPDSPKKPKQDNARQQELQEAITKAQQAIQNGAPRDAVMRRLKEAFPDVDFGA